MLSKNLAFGLALAAGLALTPAARAGDDVIRLALPDSSDVRDLGGRADDLSADVLEAGYGYRGGYRGGFGGYRGGFYGGYRGGFGGGYYSGFRGGYYGGFRGGYYGGYRGFYGGYYGGYRPFVSGYGFGYGVGYGGYGGYYGCSDVGGADVYPVCSPRTVVVRPATTYYVQPAQPQPQNPQPLPAPTPVMPRADEGGTFPYDGGPKAPVPMPQSFDEARPALLPRATPLAAETLVSLKPQQPEQKKSGKWTFPAYGEQPTRSSK